MIQKKINKQFPGLKNNRRCRRELINEIVRIFQAVESFIKIRMRSGNEKRYYTSLYKVKIMIVRPIREAMDES